MSNGYIFLYLIGCKFHLSFHRFERSSNLLSTLLLTDEDLDLGQLDELPLPALNLYVTPVQPGRAQPGVEGKTVGPGWELGVRADLKKKQDWN